MSTHITSFPLGGVLFQSGNGLPTHISTRGSLYVDLDTGIEYINRDGLIGWAIFYDSYDIFDYVLGLSGGTISGNTIVIGGLTGNTISANTLTSNSGYFSGLTATNISGNNATFNSLSANSYTGNSIITNSLTGTSIFGSNISATLISGNTIYTPYLSGTTLIGQSISGVNANFISLNINSLIGNTISGTSITGSNISTTTISGTNGTFNSLTGKTLSASSITSTTIFSPSISGNSISATTYYNLPLDIKVTGGSFNNLTDIITFTNNTGGTFNVTGLTDNYTTGTSRINDTVYFNRNDVLSAYTSNVGLSDINNRLLINDSSTGLIAFDGLSFTASATTYNIGAIKAWFVDNTTTPATPSKEYVEFSASSGNTLVNLTGQNVTYIAINSGGTITQQGAPFTPTQLRTMIRLGVIVHSNKTFINAVNNQPLVALNPANQLSDFLDSLGLINISGNTFSANGANLNINKSAGQIFKHGINFVTNNKDPHTLMLPALTAPSTIRYRYQNSIESSNTSVIDPNTYDLSGVSTTVPDTKYTVQRIYLFQSNLIRIQYGQKVYDSLDDANSGIIKDSFNVEQNLVENGLLRGLLIIKKGTTDLTDLSKVRFLDVSRLGTTIDTNLGSGLFRNEILNNGSTGLINGGAISLASSTSVNIAAGSGRIINNTTNPDLPTLTQVNWSATTGLTITNLTGQSGTVLFVTTGGTIVQQNITTFTNSNDFRDKIYIGGVGHPTGTITAIFNNPMAIVNPLSQLNDLNQSIGPFSISGNKLSKLTGTLKLFKSSGKSYFSNANYQTDKTNPSIFNVSSFSAGSLSYVTQTSFLGFVSSDINTTQFDNAGVLTVMGNNNFVAHRIWHQPSNNILFFQYGQAEYSTLSEARSRFTSENFVTPLPLEFGAYLIGIILVRKGETNLDDPTRSEIIVQGKFAGSGTGSGGSVDTLQSAYDNSTSPEIRTDATRGAVTIRNSAGTDTLNIIEGQSSGGTTTFTIKGDGSIQSNTLTGTTTRMVVADSGGTLNTQSIVNTFTTGGTFSGTVLTLVNNSGGTFNVTGFTGSSGSTNPYITGGTHAINTGISTFTNNTGGTFNVTGYFTPSNDIRITGGTHSAGTTTFINSTGGTFSVTGYLSGSTNTFTGGTVTGATNFTGGVSGTSISGTSILGQSISGNSISATTYYNLPNFTYTFTGLTSLDFGFSNGLEGDYVSTAITNSNILTTSQVFINIIPSSDHNETEDSLLDGLSFKISDIVNGVGFNINCYATNGTWGVYNLTYKIIN